MTGKDEKISSLRDLPKDIAPPRDLWQGIEARIAAEPRTVEQGSADPNAIRPGVAAPSKRYGRGTRMQVWAAAAVVAALAVGVWIGRAVLPGPTPQLLPAPVQNVSNINPQGGWSAEYVNDTKYQRQREQLVRGLEARLAALPPESRARVVSSLKAIEDSKKQLEEALGKDPSNALLQELLVNTYQDEMRLLTTVHEVDTGEGT